MTNYQKIKNMSDVELADFLDKISNQNREDWNPIGCFHCMYYGTHHSPKECVGCEWEYGILCWLKSDKPNKN